MRRALIFVVVSLAGLGSLRGADLEQLRPAASWLASERLKGTLFHDTNIAPPAPLLLTPAREDYSATAAAVALRGEHHLLILPKPGQPIRFRLKTIATRPPLESASYALFNAAGQSARG